MKQLKVKFLSLGFAVLVSFYLAFLGSFGIQKAEAVTSILERESVFAESELNFNDFGIAPRQVEFGHSFDEVRHSAVSFSGSFSPCFYPSSNRWIRLALFFPFKLSFKDLPILYRNLRI